MIDGYENFSSSDRIDFAKICRHLLKETFIVRDKSDVHQKYFKFVKKNESVFNDYFKLMGYRLNVQSVSGVVQLSNIFSSDDVDSKVQGSMLNKHTFTLAESIVLLAIWLLYCDYMTIPSLKRVITVKRVEINGKLEEIGLQEKVKKTSMNDIIGTLSFYNLVDRRGEIDDPDCEIVLYPSLQFCLDDSSFKDFVKARCNSAGADVSTISLFDDADSEDNNGE